MNHITKKIVIVDDNEIFRESLKTFLETIEGITVVGEVENGEGFLKLIQEKAVDLAFMDIDMPGINGIEATRQAKREIRDLIIIALTFHKEFSYVKEILFAGAAHYLVKDEINQEILKGIIFKN